MGKHFFLKMRTSGGKGKGEGDREGPYTGGGEERENGIEKNGRGWEMDGMGSFMWGGVETRRESMKK